MVLVEPGFSKHFNQVCVNAETLQSNRKFKYCKYGCDADFRFFFLILINFFPISNMLEKEVESGKGV